MRFIGNNRITLAKVIPTILLVLTMFAVPMFFHTSSSAYTASTSQVHNLLLYNLLYLVSPTPSYVQVNQIAFTLPPGTLPQSLTLVLASSYNGGSAQTVYSCTIATNGQITTSCSFNVPFQGWGDYLLIGSVYGSNGVLLAQTGIDPHIEPEW
jgi:hypothetical protein